MFVPVCNIMNGCVFYFISSLFYCEQCQEIDVGVPSTDSPCKNTISCQGPKNMVSKNNNNIKRKKERNHNRFEVGFMLSPSGRVQ